MLITKEILPLGVHFRSIVTVQSFDRNIRFGQNLQCFTEIIQNLQYLPDITHHDKEKLLVCIGRRINHLKAR